LDKKKLVQEAAKLLIDNNDSFVNERAASAMNDGAFMACYGEAMRALDCHLYREMIGIMEDLQNFCKRRVALGEYLKSRLG
jgi:hypothetical protein